MKSGLKLFTLLISLIAIPCSQAIMVTVDARLNSSTGGVGLDTGISLTTGQSFESSADPNDLWSAGALPRWSNADGLDGPLLATGTDESGQAAGTVIGTLFSLHSQGGASFHFGSLVGQIGSGDFFKLGTSFNGTANANGNLRLFYWDSNNFDNTDSIKVTINVPNGNSVPDQGGLILSLLGFAMLGAFSKLKKRYQSR